MFIFRAKGEARFFHEVEAAEVISTRDETNETSVRPEYQRPLRDTVERGEITSLESITFETGVVNHRGSIRFRSGSFRS